MERAMHEAERQARIRELEDLLRRAKADARAFAADADVKGPDWPGYAFEQEGRRRILRQAQAYREELAALKAAP